MRWNYGIVAIMFCILIIAGCNLTKLGNAGQLPPEYRQTLLVCQDKFGQCLDTIGPQFKELDNEPNATIEDLEALLDKNTTINYGSCTNDLRKCMDSVEK